MKTSNVTAAGFVAAILALCFAPALRAAIHTEEITYADGTTALKGFIAYDDTVIGKQPAVLIVPEWWGMNDYVKTRAKQVAELGYVAFVADIYGNAFVTEDPQAAQQHSTEAKEKGWMRSRGALAVETLKKNEHVDPQRVAGIGYCFGGGVVLELARAGTDLAGVVAFHGDVSTQQPAQPHQIKAKILILHGEADPLVPMAAVEKFKQEMTTAGADFKVTAYPNAKHAFTNPAADKYGIDRVSYNKEADQKSWDAMKQFLAEVFKGKSMK